jgi:hypothetical protein
MENVQLGFLPYCPYLFTIQLSFLPYFPYHFTIQPTFLLHFPYLFTIQLNFLLYFPFLFTNYDIIAIFLNLTFCSEHFISIRHRILAICNINKKVNFDSMYAFNPVSNFNKHHPTKMYLTQFLITSAENTFFSSHHQGRDVCAF